MQIETYEIEEKDGGTTPEVECEAVKLIESLGLEGQKSLVVKKDEGSERIGYPKMGASEMAVYKAIFPQAEAVEEYSAGIIPIRVLQVIAHAKELFVRVQVWHKTRRDPDPILVGRTSKDDYSQGKTYLLARWGDALKPYSSLVDEARVTVRQAMESELKENISTAQANMSKLDSLVEKKLRGETVYLG